MRSGHPFPFTLHAPRFNVSTLLRSDPPLITPALIGIPDFGGGEEAVGGTRRRTAEHPQLGTHDQRSCDRESAGGRQRVRASASISHSLEIPSPGSRSNPQSTATKFSGLFRTILLTLRWSLVLLPTRSPDSQFPVRIAYNCFFELNAGRNLSGNHRGNWIWRWDAHEAGGRNLQRQRLRTGRGWNPHLWRMVVSAKGRSHRVAIPSGKALRQLILH